MKPDSILLGFFLAAIHPKIEKEVMSVSGTY